MAKKRKTLVENFQEIIDSGDMDAFKAVFDKCEITATGRGKSTCNALSFRGLTPVHIQFLIDNGIDINGECGYNMTAVGFQAYRMDNLKCLIENGADVNMVLKYNENALLYAVRRHDVSAVSNLLECGAKVGGRFGLKDRTILDESLATCMNADIVKERRICELLLKAGAVKSDNTKEWVHKIGERFEFYRADFSKEHVDEFSEALTQLYKLFDVEPVPPRKIHDGKATIVVESKEWQEQHEELWDMLVPGRGRAGTVQGEIIRIVGKMLYEILDNGGINWDAEYIKMKQALVNYFNMADGMDAELREEACRLAKNVTANSGEKMLERLNELAVKWVLANPEPIELKETDYNR